MSRPQQQSQTANWINDARRRLAAWRGKRPQTKAGQIWALWPEIKVALDDGHSVNSIRLWLKEEAEIPIGTDTLRSYLSRFRTKETRQQDPSLPDPAPNAGSADSRRWGPERPQVDLKVRRRIEMNRDDTSSNAVGDAATVHLALQGKGGVARASSRVGSPNS